MLTEARAGRAAILRRNTLRIRILVVTAAAAAVAALGVASPAGAATPGSQPFAAQAAAAHLTAAQAATLQSTVDAYLTKVGGKQVALNQVVFDGGEVLVALPGEAHPRSLANPQAAQSDPCAGQLNGYFCVFSSTYYTGTEIAYWKCASYAMNWSGYGSWKNNQTAGTQAVFRNYSGGVVYTTPGAYSYSPDYNWTPVYRINIC